MTITEKENLAQQYKVHEVMTLEEQCSILEQEHPGWNQEGGERELSRMSDKKHLGNGRFSVSAETQDSKLWRRTPCLTSRLLEQRTGQKIHDNEVTGQTDCKVGSGCSKQLRTEHT